MDNVVDVSFTQKSDLEELIDHIKEYEYDEIVFVGKKGSKIFVGTTQLDEISTTLGDLYLAQRYIANQTEK